MIASEEALPIIYPDWSAPSGVKAIITCASTTDAPVNGTRAAEFGHYGPYNLALHVGDHAAKVNACREQLACQTQVANWQWLNQVHGIEVIKAHKLASAPNADASFTQQKQLACAILTADCLPVLFCNQQGTQVAAAHAGWRGLAAGVLEATCRTFLPDDKILAYLGPAISQKAFEVGAEVKAAFEQLMGREASDCFSPNPINAGHYYADLYALARIRLTRLGVQSISGGQDCTFSNNRFYSYRRQNITGRFASAIWLTD